MVRRVAREYHMEDSPARKVNTDPKARSTPDLTISELNVLMTANTQQGAASNAGAEEETTSVHVPALVSSSLNVAYERSCIDHQNAATALTGPISPVGSALGSGNVSLSHPLSSSTPLPRSKSLERAVLGLPCRLAPLPLASSARIESPQKGVTEGLQHSGMTLPEESLCGGLEESNSPLRSRPAGRSIGDALAEGPKRALVVGLLIPPVASSRQLELSASEAVRTRQSTTVPRGVQHVAQSASVLRDAQPELTHEQLLVRLSTLERQLNSKAESTPLKLEPQLTTPTAHLDLNRTPEPSRSRIADGAHLEQSPAHKPSRRVVDGRSRIEMLLAASVLLNFMQLCALAFGFAWLQQELQTSLSRIIDASTHVEL